MAEDEEKAHNSPPQMMIHWSTTWKGQITSRIARYTTAWRNIHDQSPIGHGWAIMNGKCRPVRHTLPPLPDQLKRHCEHDGSDDDSSTDTDESTFNRLWLGLVVTFSAFLDWWSDANSCVSYKWKCLNCNQIFIKTQSMNSVTFKPPEFRNDMLHDLAVANKWK